MVAVVVLVFQVPEVSQWRNRAFLLLARSLACLAKYRVDLHGGASVESGGVGLDVVQRLSFGVHGQYSDWVTQGAGYRQADVGI